MEIRKSETDNFEGIEEEFRNCRKNVIKFLFLKFNKKNQRIILKNLTMIFKIF